MTKNEFLTSLKSPIQGAILKKYPSGNVMQLWAENSALYSSFFKQNDDLHEFCGGHSGLDIATQFRDPILAAHDGTIRIQSTDRMKLGGLTIVVDSPILEDGNAEVIFSTVYAHLDEILVQAGDKVVQGQKIALEGNSGLIVHNSVPYWGNAPANFGTHCHFGLTEFIHNNGVWNYRNLNPLNNTTDPLPWLTGDWSGTSILLGNVKNLLLYWLKKLQQ